MNARLASLGLLEACRIGVAGGSRIEHGAAADGRHVAEHDAVAARGHDRRREPQLRVAARLDDAGGHGGGAVVDVKPRAVGDRRELLERDVEPVARPQAAGCDERVAAAQLAPLDARERERDPLSRLGPLDRAVVHLDAPHPHVPPGRLGAEHVALADRPRPERPGRDRPDPAQREDPVDVEAGRAVDFVFLKHKLRRAPERVAQLVEAGARLRAHRDRRRLGDELARLRERQLERLLVDGVRLRHRDDAVLEPEQADDREVLVRLRPRALAGVDHEQEEVDPGRARDHVADEALVARGRRSARAAARPGRSSGA